MDPKKATPVTFQEAPGKTQDRLEILYFPDGLGTFRNPPKQARVCGQGKKKHLA